MRNDVIRIHSGCMKKAAACTLALLAVILASYVSPQPFTGLKVMAAESGVCGDNLTWTLSDSGILTISGTGYMDPYIGVDGLYADGIGPAPWENLRDRVTEIVICEGVKRIGLYNFYDMENLEKASNYITERK